MFPIYAAFSSIGTFLAALLAFFLRRNRLLICMGGVTFLLAALSLYTLIPMLEQSGKILPDWFFNNWPITFLYLSAFALGGASAAVGQYRLRRQ